MTTRTLADFVYSQFQQRKDFKQHFIISDKSLEGGFRPGEFVMFTAKSSMDKSKLRYEIPKARVKTDIGLFYIIPTIYTDVDSTMCDLGNEAGKWVVSEQSSTENEEHTVLTIKQPCKCLKSELKHVMLIVKRRSRAKRLRKDKQRSK